MTSSAFEEFQAEKEKMQAKVEQRMRDIAVKNTSLNDRELTFLIMKEVFRLSMTEVTEDGDCFKSNLKVVQMLRQQMAEENRKKLLSLYKAPFKSDHMKIYIFDADQNMVADFMPLMPNPSFRPRGYGRFKYMENGDELHSQMSKFLIDLVKDHPADYQKCLDALNKAWGT